MAFFGMFEKLSVGDVLHSFQKWAEECGGGRELKKYPTWFCFRKSRKRNANSEFFKNH